MDYYRDTTTRFCENLQFKEQKLLNFFKKPNIMRQIRDLDTNKMILDYLL